MHGLTFLTGAKKNIKLTCKHSIMYLLRLLAGVKEFRYCFSKFTRRMRSEKSEGKTCNCEKEISVVARVNICLS